MTERTKMECIRCHGFSSARICWSCSQRPDAIDHALLEHYRKDAERYRWLRDVDKDNFEERGISVMFSTEKFPECPMTNDDVDAAIDRAMNAAPQENKARAASSGAGFKASDSGSGLPATDSSGRGLPNEPAAAAPDEVTRTE